MIDINNLNCAEFISELPDDMVSYQKSLFGYILEGIRMLNVRMYILYKLGICYGHLVYRYVAIW
jgi:hypothetical protein